MGALYRELIHKMQQRTGFSDAEAEDALDLMVEGIAERLTDEERTDFASQLPADLQDIALGAHMTERKAREQDLIHEFMEKERIEEARAKKQVMGAWEILKSLISDGQLRHIKSQMPDHVAAQLT
jgi:uncharacterized protein (DUF2267 family)